MLVTARIWCVIVAPVHRIYHIVCMVKFNPYISGHFRFMSEVWLLGLRIVVNINVLKMAGIGVLILIMTSIFL